MASQGSGRCFRGHIKVTADRASFGKPTDKISVFESVVAIISEQSLTTTEKLIADDHIQPEEEALGYSNTVLLHVGSLTERSRQILQRDKVARKELVVEEEFEVDDEAAETMNDISEDAMSAWNNIDDDSQDDDSDYEWDNNEEEVDDQDDHDDTEPHTISWDSYKNVDNIDGLDFIPPKPYVKGSMSPLEIAYVDLMYRLNHHNIFKTLVMTK